DRARAVRLPVAADHGPDRDPHGEAKGRPLQRLSERGGRDFRDRPLKARTRGLLAARRAARPRRRLVPGMPAPISQSLCFGGVQSIHAHDARETRCPMRFGLFLPPQASAGPVPLLYWLSGLTCTEENFVVKAGAQRVAAALGLAIVVPDTSPRGASFPGDRDSYDFGVGAGF